MIINTIKHKPGYCSICPDPTIAFYQAGKHLYCEFHRPEAVKLTALLNRSQ